MLDEKIRKILARGIVIPAHPLALNSARKLDERRQRALTRYYIAAGAGGLAVAVHTTQFAIRQEKIGLFEPVLKLAAEEMARADRTRAEPVVRVGGVCGKTPQAVREAGVLNDLGYHAGLLSLGAMREEAEDALIAHCRLVGEIIPLVGFYLQPSVGGRLLSYGFWRRFLELPSLVAIKIAPFNRYQTLDVMRAVIESGREDVAIYTGNDDNIVADLLTPYRFNGRERRIVGGLLGHWSVGTKSAVEVLRRCHAAVGEKTITPDLLRLNIEVTDANAAYFDPAHAFAGCIAGLHEVLRRQGLLEGIWCLDPKEGLSPGQNEEIDRVLKAYPHLHDNEFVAEHRDAWLRG